MSDTTRARDAFGGPAIAVERDEPMPASAMPHIVARSGVMKDVLTMAARAGRTGAKVLITGESGVGKEVIARAVHAHSARATRPLVTVNCAAFNENLLESELFGHVRGSFTGAHRDKPGKLRLAHGGTLFLDEVGEMSLRMQALLLRFLENGELQQVGADAPSMRVDVRVIAATNRNLDEMVAQGLFRQDFLYRLRVVQVHIPPLRERAEDVRALIEHFIARSGRTLRLSVEAQLALERYSWPGNVRELQNALEQIVWMSPGPVVELPDLPPFLRSAAASSRSAAHGVGAFRQDTADDLFDGLTSGRYAFWRDIHRWFLDREITKHDVRELVRRGLSQTAGNYRALLRLFGMSDAEYKKFLNFLATHDCSVDYHAFRPTRPARVAAAPAPACPIPAPVSTSDIEEPLYH